MTDKTIKKKPKNLRLSVKKAIFLANEKILKVVNDLVSHKGSKICVGWIKIKFSNIVPKQKQNEC